MDDDFEKYLEDPLESNRRVPWSKLGIMRKKLKETPIGERFFSDDGTNEIYFAAKQVGAKITRRKLPKGGWIYERIS